MSEGKIGKHALVKPEPVNEPVEAAVEQKT